MTRLQADRADRRRKGPQRSTGGVGRLQGAKLTSRREPIRGIGPLDEQIDGVAENTRMKCHRRGRPASQWVGAVAAVLVIPPPQPDLHGVAVAGSGGVAVGIGEGGGAPSSTSIANSHTPPF